MEKEYLGGKSRRRRDEIKIWEKKERKKERKNAKTFRFKLDSIRFD